MVLQHALQEQLTSGFRRNALNVWKGISIYTANKEELKIGGCMCSYIISHTLKQP